MYTLPSTQTVKFVVLATACFLLLVAVPTPVLAKLPAFCRSSDIPHAYAGKVVLVAKPVNVARGGYVYSRLFNGLRRSVGLGERYLQRYVEGEWTALPPVGSKEGTPIQPPPIRRSLSAESAGQCRSFKVDSERPPGRYRIVNEVYLDLRPGANPTKRVAEYRVREEGSQRLDAHHWRPKERSALRAPLSAMQQRCIACSHDEALIARWSSKHYPNSYAGMYVEDSASVRFRVGFTRSQRALISAIKELPGLVKPGRVARFPYVPRSSLEELRDLEQRVVGDLLLSEAHPGVAVSVGVVVQRNIVLVGSGHVKHAKAVLSRLYGRDAPIRVRYEKPPMEV